MNNITMAICYTAVMAAIGASILSAYFKSIERAELRRMAAIARVIGGFSR